MHDFSLLHELFVVFCSAIVVVLIFHRLRLPPIAGLLFCGLVVGPHGLNLITRLDDIEVLAEIGVVLLLFTIGLEFSLAELRRIKRQVLLGGSLQMLTTSLFAFVLASLSGLRTPHAIFLSQIFALSSTAIVLSVLASRGEMESPHGRMILGILLFQDLWVVPMMLMAPLLHGEGGLQLLPLLISFGKALLLIALVLTLAVFIVPRVLEQIVRVREREILVLGAVIICIGTAWLTSALGLSLALGAFIAGLAISESRYGHQVFAEILPFKDVFNSLFFISVGMLLDLKFAFTHLRLLAVLVLGTIVGKALLAGVTARALSPSTRTALLVGMAIAQIGEFSFVLARLGVQHDLLDANLYQGFLAVAVTTMMATPLLISLAPAFARHMPEGLDGRLGRERGHLPSPQLAAMQDHTIIVGFGLNGRYLARVLKDSSIPYCILELNPQTVRDAQATGEPICFGDATRLEILRQVNLDTARILVITTDEIAVGRRLVAIARQHRRDLYLIVRTKFAAYVEELYELGANQVIAEEFEAATEIFGRVLAEYDVPRNAIQAYIETIRREGAMMLRRPQLPPASLEKLRQLLAGNVVENFLLLENSPAVGKTLAQLDMRNQTGATVIAIVRDHQSHANPAADFVLAANDLLVIMGTHRELDRATSLLDPPARQTA